MVPEVGPGPLNEDDEVRTHPCNMRTNIQRWNLLRFPPPGRGSAPRRGVDQDEEGEPMIASLLRV